VAALEALSEAEGSAADRLGEAARAFAELAGIDARLAPHRDEAEDLKRRIADLAAAARDAAAGIEAKVKVDKMKGPDLGGYKDTKGPGVLLQYQRQEIELDGKKHKKKYEGTSEDFDAILAWLAGLKKAE